MLGHRKYVLHAGGDSNSNWDRDCKEQPPYHFEKSFSVQKQLNLLIKPASHRSAQYKDLIIINADLKNTEGI